MKKGKNMTKKAKAGAMKMKPMPKGDVTAPTPSKGKAMPPKAGYGMKKGK